MTSTAETVPAALRQRVLARIDDDEVVRLAQDLVRIPSFTTEETACAEWLAGYLSDQGLDVTLQEIEPGRKQTIARLHGRGGGRSIMLNGHIDIDPLATGWTLVLGLDFKGMVLLGLTLLVATLSLGTGRTTILQGAVHLVIFAVYLFTTIVP